MDFKTQMRRWLASTSAAIAMTTGLALAPVAQAVPLEVTSSPQGMFPGFTHNVFHDASTPGDPTNGNILAWLDLDTGASNSYDPTSGALNVTMDIFTASNLSTNIGSAVGMGSIPAANLANPADSSLAGTITWVIQATGGTSFANYLAANFTPAGDGSYSITQSFLNERYSTPNPNVPNTYTNNLLSLWGADGYDGSDFTSPKFGIDVVWEVEVPTPAALSLLGVGMVSLVATRRRRAA